MGAGKTTIGKLLAEKLNVNFEDLDEMIIVEYGLSINQIFSKYGETTFRSAESNALISSRGNVISCGGGIILDKKNRDYINEGLSFFLNVDLAELEKRLKYQNSRPLLDSDNLNKTLNSIWKEREKMYIQTANHVININSQSPNEIVQAILGYIK